MLQVEPPAQVVDATGAVTKMLASAETATDKTTKTEVNILQSDLTVKFPENRLKGDEDEGV